MGNRTFKIATSGLLALVIGAVVTATPAASESLTDRFKSLFGGKSDEQQPPIVDNKEPAPDLNCPPVGIRAGASTYAVAAPGKERPREFTGKAGSGCRLFVSKRLE